MTTRLTRRSRRSSASARPRSRTVVPRESLEETEAMFDQVQERFGRLDFYVSNASASNFRPIMELKPHHLERTFNLNVRAFVIGSQRATRLMDKGGRITHFELRQPARVSHQRESRIRQGGRGDLGAIHGS